MEPSVSQIPMIPPVVDELVRQLAAIPATKRVILFGSRARGDAWERADIDIAVEAPDASWEDWAWMDGLAEAAPTLLRIDLVNYGKASGRFLQRIDKEGRVLYERRELA